MSKPKASPADQGCPHNRMLDCPGPVSVKCAKCGWNPAVAKRRTKKWMTDNVGKTFIIFRRRYL